MMNPGNIGWITLWCCLCCEAQQLPQYSQYLTNDYVLNPAIGGSRDRFEAKSNHRYQWTGITDAPRTYILSMHGPLHSGRVGVGGYVLTDVTGPTSRFGGYLSYAYHISVADSIRVSLGLFGGILQYNVDGTRITLNDEADPVLTDKMLSVTIPDAGFGVYTYGERFYFGASVPQLLQNKLKLPDVNNPLGNLKSHFFIMGGYRLKLLPDYEVEPSILLKAVAPVPVQADLSARIIYRSMLWLGGTWRSYDAMALTVGYAYYEQLLIAYSYDFTTSGLKRYSEGTHEIMLGIRFRKMRNRANENREQEEMLE